MAKNIIDKLVALLGSSRNATPTPPVPFGYKNSWFAVQATDTQAVLGALPIRSQKPASWSDGLESTVILNAGHDARAIFIAPPVQGWIFIVGNWTWRSHNRCEWQTAEARIAELSKRFPEVQAFATHRVVEYHHWIKARDGRIERSFAYLGERGEIQRNIGPVTDGESILSFWREPEDAWSPDEHDVMTVASRWSFAPIELSESSAPAGLGTLARLK